MNNYSLTITHLYPKEMNIYGDMGNIITLKKRAEWRDIKVTVKEVHKEQSKAFPKGDIYFMGGGQDNDMYAVFEDLLKYKKDFIKSEVEADKIFLLICGAFQLFGKYFLDASGRRIDGLDILPVETKAPGDQLADRCLGNIITYLTPELKTKILHTYNNKFEDTVVGFENHSGQTYFLNEKATPIGVVSRGKGNNSTDKLEGAKLKNIFASYTHGSLLPKNPHIADLILSLALENKYNEKIFLKPLDDSIEWNAHRFISENY